METLPLMEAFYTIQGEGYHQGKAAYFIRLGGCDVGCHWCDVKESWDAGKFRKVAVKNIVQDAGIHPSRVAVITGGEPLRHNLDELTRELRSAGFRTHLETSGVYPLSGQWDWICLSPKKFRDPLPENWSRADELKVIIFNKDDLSWAEKQAKNVTGKCRLYLQPEWSRMNVMMQKITDHIKNHPQWEISLQIHKFMNIP